MASCGHLINLVLWRAVWRITTCNNDKDNHLLMLLETWFLCAANIVLEDAIERIFVGDTFGDIPLGIFLVRGENVVLLGEVVCRPWLDLAARVLISTDGSVWQDNEKEAATTLKQVSISEILELFRQAEAAKKPAARSTPQTTTSAMPAATGATVGGSASGIDASCSLERQRQDALMRIRNEHALNDESV